MKVKPSLVKSSLTWFLPQALLVLLHFGQDEVEFLVLLPILVRVQGAGLYQILQQLRLLLLLTQPELPTFALAVHPLRF